MKAPRSIAAVLGIAALLAVPAAGAAATGGTPARNLDELLQEVRSGWNVERKENDQREAEFRKAKSEQQALLAKARAALAGEEERSKELEKRFNDNELRITQLEQTLQERLGNLGEAFGVVRQVAGDTIGQFDISLISAQLADRSEYLSTLAQSKALPSIESLEKLWYALQQEMTESGKVVRFPATVVSVDGDEGTREVTRIGGFNAVSDGKYLIWDKDLFKLVELGRQPSARHSSAVAAFEAARSGLVPFSVDPSRGQLLSLLVQTPSARERVDQGGPIGYTIIVLGILAGLLGLARWVYMIVVGRRVAAQKKTAEISKNNPLGRVLSVYDKNAAVDVETLELKLDEAILRESAKLDRYLWAVKVVSVVAPLLGLLGTVTGMIRTFQVITLYGTGDPKLMAGGISEALVTTMLGLFVAIPLVFLHAMVSTGSKKVVDVLEEQSAGLIAQRAEQSDAAA